MSAEGRRDFLGLAGKVLAPVVAGSLFISEGKITKGGQDVFILGENDTRVWFPFHARVQDGVYFPMLTFIVGEKFRMYGIVDMLGRLTLPDGISLMVNAVASFAETLLDGPLYKDYRDLQTYRVELPGISKDSFMAMAEEGMVLQLRRNADVRRSLFPWKSYFLRRSPVTDQVSLA